MQDEWSKNTKGLRQAKGSEMFKKGQKRNAPLTPSKPFELFRAFIK